MVRYVVLRQMWRFRMAVVAGILAAYGATSVIWRLPIVVDGVVGVLGLLLFVVDMQVLRDQERLVRPRKRLNDLYHDINCGPGEIILRSGVDCGVFLAPETLRLRSPVIADVQPTEYVVPSWLDAWSLRVIAAESHHRKVFNGQVVGLASDIPHADSPIQRSTLQGCNYVSFIGTNLLAAYDIQQDVRGKPGRYWRVVLCFLIGKSAPPLFRQ